MQLRYECKCGRFLAEIESESPPKEVKAYCPSCGVIVVGKRRRKRINLERGANK